MPLKSTAKRQIRKLEIPVENEDSILELFRNTLKSKINEIRASKVLVDSPVRITTKGWFPAPGIAICLSHDESGNSGIRESPWK